MKLARFWVRQPGEATGPDGERVRTIARGWSNESVESAGAVARDRARNVAERIASGQTKAQQYGYGDRPLPEPVVREFQDGAGTASAVITRNAYGALVMNSRDLMFVDIDREDAPAAQNLVSSVFSLFSKPKPVSSPADTVVSGIQRVAERNNLSGRTYKTAGGYRVLIVSPRFDATGGSSESLLREFGSDPLYIRLCKMQESFRARLTPKPWRCDLPQPPVTFPFETPKEESLFRDWETKYASVSSRYATCRLLGTFGSSSSEAGFRELVEYHDVETKAGSALPLA